MQSISFSVLDYYFVNNYIPRYACHMLHQVCPQFLYFRDEIRKKKPDLAVTILTFYTFMVADKV